MKSENQKKQTVSDMVYEHLKKSIISGEWQPGDKIASENQLCKTLGASRISVRSAINRLASIGLLESRQGEGTYVCKHSCLGTLNSMIPMFVLDQPDRIDMFEFRKIIEVESAGLAALRATASMVEEMRSATIRMVEAETIDDIAKHDMEFHHLLAKATGNRVIVRVFEILRDTYIALLEENVSKMGAYGARYHHLILSAIEIRNAELAKQYMMEHLDETIRRTMNPYQETEPIAALSPDGGAHTTDHNQKEMGQ